MPKGMGIKRLDHVAWAVRKLDDALPLLTELMGMTVEGRFEDPDVGFRGVGLRGEYPTETDRRCAHSG